LQCAMHCLFPTAVSAIIWLNGGEQQFGEIEYHLYAVISGSNQHI
jgi:hypothetical protein